MATWSMSVLLGFFRADFSRELIDSFYGLFLAFSELYFLDLTADLFAFLGDYTAINLGLDYSNVTVY